MFSKNIRDESVLDWTEHADLAFRNDPFVGVAYSPFKGLQLVVAGGSGLNEATQVYEDLRSSKVGEGHALVYVRIYVLHALSSTQIPTIA